MEPTLHALRALPGVGEWTAQMIAMRVLAWTDAWPAGDIAVLRACSGPGQPRCTPRQAEALADAWRPWPACAVVRLWQTLEETGR